MKDDALELLRNGYLKLRSALHDRTTRFPSYTMLFDELRAMLDERRHMGVLHIEPENIDLVESLYGWQAFDRTMAQLAAVVKTMPGVELPPLALLAVGGVPGDRFIAFIPEAVPGRLVSSEELGALSAAVKVRLDVALEEEPFASLTPRIVVKVGYAFLSEDPFYRFERRVHAAVAEARALPDLRERGRDGVWGDELKKAIREHRWSVRETRPRGAPMGGGLGGGRRGRRASRQLRGLRSHYSGHAAAREVRARGAPRATREGL